MTNWTGHPPASPASPAPPTFRDADELRAWIAFMASALASYRDTDRAALAADAALLAFRVRR